MPQSASTTPHATEHAHPDSPPRSPRKPRQNYRQLNHMRAPNRSAEEIAAEKADKEQRQRDKVTKKRKNTTNLAQFENDAVNELLQKGHRAAQPPAATQQKAPRVIAQVNATSKSSSTTQATSKVKTRRQLEEIDEDEEAALQEEAPTENEFDEESHGSDAEQDVAPSDDDDYEDEPQATKAKPPAVKKPKKGKVIYDDVQRTRDGLLGRGQADQRAANTVSKTKPDGKKGGVRNAYKNAPTPRNPPAQNVSRPSVAPEPADIQAGYGGVADNEEDEDEEEEREHAKKTVVTGKVARTTSTSIAKVTQVIEAPKASTRTKKGKSPRAATPPKQSNLPDVIRHNFSTQYLLQALALFGVAQDTNNPYRINDEPQLFRTAFKYVYPSAIFKQYGKNIASGELIFQLTSAKFRSWRNVLRTAGENVVNGFFTSVHPKTGERLFPTADSIRIHVQNILHDWGRAKGGQAFHWRVFTTTNKSGAYEDRLLMKILARHFDLIANINTSWLPSQEPFTAMLLALISYICALNLWSTGVFDTKEAAAAMNDDKWGAEAEKQAKRLRSVMQGKPEKWLAIVSLAKAEMKKSSPARSHGTEIDNDDSEDEPMFLSGDEIDVQSEGEGKGESEGEEIKGRDEDVIKDGEGEDVVEVNVDEDVDEARKKSPMDGREAVHHERGTVTKIRSARDMTRKGGGVESDRAEEDAHDVSTPVAPKLKKARSGKERSRAKAKAKADTRTGGTRDVGRAGDDTEDVVPTATRKRKRRAVVVESEPEDEPEDISLDAGSCATGSPKRRKVEVVGVVDSRDAEHS